MNATERAKRHGSVPYYGATGQVGWIDEPLFDEELLLLGEDGAPFLDKSKPIAYVIDGPSWVNNHAHVLRARPTVASNRYLKYFLDSFDFSDRVGGSTRDKLTQRDMNSIPVLLAPAEQQRQIVRMLDEIGARRASVADRLQGVRNFVERLRVAVLGSAFAQLERTVPVISLQSVLREPLKNGYSARPVGRVTSTRVLTLTATTSGYFDPEHFKYTDDEIPTDSPLWLEPGDILIQRGNTAELVGMPAVYDGAPREFIYPDLMIRARVSDGVDPSFVWYMLLAPQTRAFLRDRAIGTAGNMPKINQKTVNAVPLPLPSREEQGNVVRSVKAALDTADRVGKAISVAETALGGSVRGALAKAFRGELVPSETEPSVAASWIR